MIFWLVLSFLNDSAIVTFVILDKLYLNPFPTSSATISIWGIRSLEDPFPVFTSLGIFIVFRLYLLQVGLQGGISLHRKYDTSKIRSINEDISNIEVCLEPIGYGIREVWEFFKDFPAMGSIVLLTTEMVIIKIMIEKSQKL